VSWAIIKPHFTPIHLTQGADLIIAGPLQATAAADHRPPGGPLRNTLLMT